jgi:carboxypeptidase Taq
MLRDCRVMSAIDDLRARLAEISDLGAISYLVDWDAMTHMPPGGGKARAEHRATIERIAHERLTDPGLGALLARLPEEEAIVRVARRDHEKARRVPAELIAELARERSLSERAWEQARPASDFAAVRPHLERILELRLRYIDCFPEVEHPYDALLDDYEPDMRTAELREVLGRLRDGLVALLEAIAPVASRVDPAPLLDGPFPVEGQRAVVRRVLAAVGVEDDRWRVDLAAHPFAVAIARDDVRLTTRYDDAHLDSLFAAIHEFGHGLYEQGVDPALERTTLDHGTSSGVHESQSRLWENMVGRSAGFWRWCFPLFQDAIPERFAALTWEDAHRAANAVRPSLIRVVADEVTYGLHIAVRFELELELIERRLSVSDLPEAWNDLYRRYLGMEVPNHRDGVMQDVHWYAGAFGYFPTYSLGNVIAGQLWARLRAEVPGLDDGFAQGEFGPLREWLRERVHRFGRTLTPVELIERACGGPLDPAPLLAHLWDKLGPLYGLPSATLMAGQ